MKIILLILTVTLAVSNVNAQTIAGSGTEADPWQIGTLEELQDIRNLMKGDGGYSAFRSPAMVVTNEGTILAFTEGRLATWRDDAAMDDLVVKRSEDGGQTWGELIVAASDDIHSCKNPTPVVLPSGHILLIYTWTEYYGEDSSDRDRRRVHMVWSDDDGRTWSEPRDLTPMVYKDEWDWYGTGPGHGIVKELEPHAGRIIIPARHNIRGEQAMASHIIYSDDDGETWHIGAIALRDPKRSNESTAVELSNGNIMLNSRTTTPGEIHRVVSISSDGGETFDSIELDSTLIEPPAQGSILKHSLNEQTGKYNILFSNPRSSQQGVRVYGTLLLSKDDGQTWSRQFRYSGDYPTFSGYSDNAVINEEGDVGVIYESGRHYDSPIRWDGIYFTTIGFDEIIDDVTIEYPDQPLKAPGLGEVPTEHVLIFDGRDGYYVQTADIDASETENWNNGRGFISIGDEFDTFTGNFDGNGYTISNLTLKDENHSGVGLFGWFGVGKIKNVQLENVDIVGSAGTGGLVGRNMRGIVENSSVVNGTVRTVTTSRGTGGLVGENSGGKITDSYAKVDVSGSRDVGGLVGQNDEGGIIINSYATGSVATVLGDGHDAGGLVGKNMEGSEIHNSFAAGNVTVLSNARRAGGLVGQHMDDGSVITNSYATGDVKGGDRFIGGFVGRSRDEVTISGSYSTGTTDAASGRGILTTAGFAGESSDGSLIVDSYWDTESSENDRAVGEGDTEGEIMGLTTDQMTGEAAPDYMTGLDFGENWQTSEGYPMLFWQDGDEVTSGGQDEVGSEDLPGKFRLVQNHPNPFNPVTTIGFELPADSEVRLEIYDLLGRRVAVPVSDEYQPGRHEVRFDASGLSSGVYLYRLTAGEFTETRRMMLVK